MDGNGDQLGWAEALERNSRLWRASVRNLRHYVEVRFCPKYKFQAFKEEDRVGSGKIIHALSSRDTNRILLKEDAMMHRLVLCIPDEIVKYSVNLRSRNRNYAYILLSMKNDVCDKYSKLCCICLCDYEDGDELRILPCNHHFHSKCIFKWMEQRKLRCPLCNGAIPKKWKVLKEIPDLPAGVVI